MIDESETKAQYYLYEKYQNDRRRRPSRMLNYYYTVKDMIPAGLRHRLNSLADQQQPAAEFSRLALRRLAVAIMASRVGFVPG